MYKLSVIIPFYNSKDYLAKCIDSVLNQTLKDIQIILVDDGSTDNSEEIVKNFIKKHKNIKYIYQENGRQGKARNNGLRYAQGEYIAFVDSDDYLDKNMYKDMYIKAKENDYDIVICDCIRQFEDYNEFFKGTRFDFIDNDNVTKQEYFLSLPCPCNKIFKREFLLNCNFSFPEGIIYEDFVAIPALAIYNPNVSYIQKPYYYYIQSDNSTTRNLTYQEKYEHIFPAVNILYDKVINDIELKDELEYVITKNFLYYSSLDFFKFEKYDNIKKISKFMKKKFPNWMKNKYLKKESLKFRILSLLFYYNKVRIINFITRMKRVCK